jgi:acyl-CoA synthetase (AMP-forming)/AMP-acid ligase II
MELPGVRAAVVVEAPAGHDRRPLKVVVVAEGQDRAAIEATVRAWLSDSNLPAQVEVREELPTSPAGKILRKYLA